MQSKKSQSTGRGILLGVLILLAGIVNFSCGKKNTSSVAGSNTPSRMEDAAVLLHGTTTSGSLITYEDSTRLTMECNKGSLYILVDKLLCSDNAGLPPATSAELITSDHGVIIKDLTSKKLVFLANNDDVSIRQMEQARTLLKDDAFKSTVFGIIYGTTLVHAPSSHKEGI